MVVEERLDQRVPVCTGMSSRWKGDLTAKLLILIGATIFFLVPANAASTTLPTDLKVYESIENQQKLDNGHGSYLLLTAIQKTNLLKSTNSTSITLLNNTFKILSSEKWPLATVYYKIHPNLSKFRKSIENALRLWEERSCLIFNEIPVEQSFDKPHISFQSNTNKIKCRTHYGMIREETQAIYLGEKCDKIHQISRLIGYSVGILHQPDADIVYGKNEVYKKYVGKSSYSNVLIPSFADSKNIKQLYKCNFPECKQKPCQNGGISMSNCKCLCPASTSGPNCEKAVFSSLEKSKCGGIITQEKLIETPRYPMNYVHGMECVWVITPEEGNAVELMVNDFHIEETPSCSGDHLTISTHSSINDEKRYCGRSLAANDIVSNEADRNVVVTFRTSAHGTGRGFSFKVRFLEDFLETGTVSNLPEESL